MGELKRDKERERDRESARERERGRERSLSVICCFGTRFVPLYLLVSSSMLKFQSFWILRISSCRKFDLKDFIRVAFSPSR